MQSIHSSNKYFCASLRIPGTVLSPGNTIANKTGIKYLVLMEFISYWELGRRGDDKKSSIYSMSDEMMR